MQGKQQIVWISCLIQIRCISEKQIVLVECWQFIKTCIYFESQQCTDGSVVSVEEVCSSVPSLFRHLEFPR